MNIEIRKATERDAPSFFRLPDALDRETEYMMLEPGERVWDEAAVKSTLNKESDLVLGAFSENEMIRFLSAERCAYKRNNKYIAYIVVWVRKAHCHQGLGTTFICRLGRMGKRKSNYSS